jgi:hypothetical protein
MTGKTVSYVEESISTGCVSMYVAKGNVQTLQEVTVNYIFRSLIICVLHVILLQFKKQDDDNRLEWS